MPDTNSVFLTRKEAEASAKWWAQTFRDDGDRVRGAASRGFYEVGEYQCIEITSCTEPSCLEDIND